VSSGSNGLARAATNGPQQNQNAQPASSSAAPASPFNENVIAEISPGSEVKEVVLSKDHVAWVEEQSGKYTVRLDGKQQGGTYREIRNLDGDSDFSHLVFFGKLDSKWVFVMDGREGTQQYTYATSIAFQPGGSSYAYTACVEKTCHIFVNGKEAGPEYQEISYPVYSYDGKDLAYAGRRDKKWIAVVDGKETGADLDAFVRIAFMPGGSRLLFLGRRRDEFLYAVDGVSGPAFMAISPINFSADGNHYTYGGTMAKGGFTKQKVSGTVVLDGQPTLTFEGKGMSGSWTEFGGAQEIMRGGLRNFSPDFDGISNPQFSHDGKLVYAVRRDKGDMAVFVGMDAGPGFEDILSHIVFTHDGNHFVYIARRGNDFVEVRDNVPGKICSASQRSRTLVNWIKLNNDATHTAYETAAGGKLFEQHETLRALRSVVIDGKEGPQYDAQGLTNFDFDPDSGHYFYNVIGAKGKHDLVNVNGQESRLYDRVAGSRFGDEKRFMSFFALDGSHILRVTYQFQGANAPKPGE
jgi:hypothetical protein